MSENGILIETYDPSNAERVEWLWEHRLVKSAFNLIIGEEKVGKGTLVSWIISQVTRGRFEVPAAHVGVIGYEDSWRKVWTPRLASVNARDGWVHNLKKENGQISLKEDMTTLVTAIKRQKIKLLYVDQLLDNLSADTDSHHQKHVRDDLSPLEELTERSGVTIIATMHPNKRGATFREWQAGSPAFVAAARQTLALCRHPDVPEKRVLTVARSNYGSMGHSMSFDIASGSVVVKGSNGRPARTTVGHVVNRQRCELGIEELLEVSGSRKMRQSELERFLTELVGTNGGMKATDVFEACEEKGFGDRMVRRAAARVGIRSVRVGTGGHAVWKLS